MKRHQISLGRTTGRVGEFTGSYRRGHFSRPIGVTSIAHLKRRRFQTVFAISFAGQDRRRRAFR